MTFTTTRTADQTYFAENRLPAHAAIEHRPYQLLDRAVAQPVTIAQHVRRRTGLPGIPHAAEFKLRRVRGRRALPRRQAAVDAVAYGTVDRHADVALELREGQRNVAPATVVVFEMRLRGKRRSKTAVGEHGHQREDQQRDQHFDQGETARVHKTGSRTR